MARIKPISPDTASGETKDLYNMIEGKLGVVPNMMQTMANSTAFLQGYLHVSAALGEGTLGFKTGELTALTVAEANGCDYCLSATLIWEQTWQRLMLMR